jgi:bifunctional N-acetylglucosamine-1-phosphate-uridyltransferase/glucosamine-1-phosphate-acetyltransferase GlmU-like protein
MNSMAIILAAGKGSRMRSELPKPIVPLNGKGLSAWIVDAFRKAGINDIYLIVGYKADEVKSSIGNSVQYILQKEQNGTAHAVLQGKDVIDYKGKNVFVFVGDSPLITADTIAKLEKYHNEKKAACTFLTADFRMELPYARVVRDIKGNFLKCVEEKDASPEELKINELLSSHFIFNGDILFETLPEIKKEPKNGEYYLTDIIQIIKEKGQGIEVLKIDSYEELVGLNTPEDIEWAQKFLARV